MKELVRLQPGPVTLSQAVQAALAKPRRIHRDPAFVEDVNQVRNHLLSMTGSQEIAIMAGTGTHANDAVALHLGRRAEKGLILVSGEFGRRLVFHARGAHLDFEIFQVPEGQRIEAEQLETQLKKTSVDWVWGAHLETSTGALLDIEALAKVCKQNKTRLVLDCVSSLGLVPTDLTGVSLATSVSGKSLGVPTGLTFVFSDRAFTGEPDVLPPSLDLTRYGGSIPTTLESSLIEALLVALNQAKAHPFWEKSIPQGHRLYDTLVEAGHTLLTPKEVSAPQVMTLVLPETVSSVALGDWLAEKGYLLAYQSHYRREKNWIQVCLMSVLEDSQLEPLPGLLNEGIRALENRD